MCQIETCQVPGTSASWTLREVPREELSRKLQLQSEMYWELLAADFSMAGEGGIQV